MHPAMASGCARWKATLFRLACIVSLWQAPVPWVHCHAAVADLPHHLAAFHQQADEFTVLDWHWHASLPPWGQSESGDETPASPPRLQFSSAVASPVVDFETGPVISVGFFALPNDPARIAPIGDASRQFLSSLLADQTAQVVLNVRLC
jgi:hypothetical protein